MWAVCRRLFILPSQDAQGPVVLFLLLRRVWGCVLPYCVVITLEFQFIRSTATRYNNNMHWTEQVLAENSNRIYRIWEASVSDLAAGVSGVSNVSDLFRLCCFLNTPSSTPVFCPKMTLCLWPHVKMQGLSKSFFSETARSARYVRPCIRDDCHLLMTIMTISMLK